MTAGPTFSEDVVFDDLAAPNDDDRSSYRFVNAIFANLPYGKAWAIAPGGLMHRLFTGLSREYVRVRHRASDLLLEIDPLTSTEMLAEREADYGLPNACTTPDADLATRQSELLAKMTSKLPPRPANMIAIAEAFSYTNVTITDTMHNPFTIGSAIGDSMENPAGGWLWTWILHLPDQGDVRNLQMECQVRELAPAHTYVAFRYDADDSSTYVVGPENV